MKYKGKCKRCIGCEKRNEIGFKGVNSCNYYKHKYSDKWLVFTCIVIELILLASLIIAFCIKLNILAGG